MDTFIPRAEEVDVDISDILTGSSAPKAKTAQKILEDVNKSKSSHVSPWFRGDHTNYVPDKLKMTPETAVRDQVLNGWLPDAPQIGRDTQVTAFGSCFAANISNWLSKRNYRVLTKDNSAKDAYVVSMGEGMVNSFVIRQQFEWAWENADFQQDLWHGYDATSYGYDESIRLQTKKIFDETDVFVLTFGLSEVWYDEVTGSVFWRTIPKEVYDPSRHKFRVSTAEENRDNIEAIYQLIRKHRPDAKIIMTLSPIPLIATFRDNSCLTSNSVSKAVLRVAIDEVVRKHKDEGALYYWPSYEIVTDVFHLPYREDRRHIEPQVLSYIMTEFEHRWCLNDDAPAPSLITAWVSACAASGKLPRALIKACKRRDVELVEKIMQRKAICGSEAMNTEARALLQRMLDEWETEAAP